VGAGATGDDDTCAGTGSSAVTGVAGLGASERMLTLTATTVSARSPNDENRIVRSRSERARPVGRSVVFRA
jgi:hypothetical protein